MTLVNQERAKAGCQPVKANAKLTAAAQGHSNDSAARRVLSHTGSDGSSANQRVARTGYSASWVGEVVSLGGSTPAQLMSVWMRGFDRDTILNCSARELGAGLATPGGNYWTLVLATPR
ncbi:CAP domain-containing protein [Streptomyces sp. NPDC047023]|uniref:CAP domain-containing protein n=1 Tax=Streptomyces sp. NPDC047023 TaxID=3155139 RepID=UPI0033D213C3